MFNKIFSIYTVEKKWKVRKIVRIFGVKIHLPAIRKNIIGNNNIVNIEKHGGGYMYAVIIT